MSVDILTEYIASWTSKTLILDGARLMSLDLYPAETTKSTKPATFAARWPTDKLTQEGLDAIRKSYSCFRANFVEPRKRLKGIIRGRVFTNPVGEVNFYLRGHDDPTPLDLDTFLEESRLKHTSDDPNPLCWIRVNNEYADYYFDGEYIQEKDLIVRNNKRRAGLLGKHNVAPQLVEFYQMTGTALPGTKAQEIHEALNEIFAHLPKLQQR